MRTKNICHKYKFHNILILSCNKFTSYNYNKDYSFNKLIPIEWQMLLMSDGSFTQNLNSLTNNTISIELISNDIKVNSKYHMREVLLKDYHRNLAFAKSLWSYNEKNLLLLQDQPIGQSLIKFKMDIYKEIHEVYYGYSKSLNRIFKSNEPLWGKKYTLYYKHQPLITIQEFFSPKLINFFEKYK